MPFLAAFGVKDWIIAGLAALCVLLALNTYLDFHIGPIGFEGWKPKAERFERERDSCITAGEANAAAQKAQKAAYEAKYKELAHVTDEKVQRAQSDAMRATDAYIERRRLPRNQGGVSTAPAAPGDSGSGGSDSASGAPELVAVSESDIRICTTNTIRLEAARDWALSLTAD